MQLSAAFEHSQYNNRCSQSSYGKFLRYSSELYPRDHDLREITILVPLLASQQLRQGRTFSMVKVPGASPAATSHQWSCCCLYYVSL